MSYKWGGGSQQQLMASSQLKCYDSKTQISKGIISSANALALLDGGLHQDLS